MLSHPLRLRAPSLLVTALLAGAVAGDAAAQPKRKGGKVETPEEKAAKQACVDAHTKGQALSHDGKLATAREEFIACGRETCPGAIRQDCVTWLTEATESQPSVVVEARDEHGKQ